MHNNKLCYESKFTIIEIFEQTIGFFTCKPNYQNFFGYSGEAFAP